MKVKDFLENFDENESSTDCVKIMDLRDTSKGPVKCHSKQDAIDRFGCFEAKRWYIMPSTRGQCTLVIIIRSRPC